MLRPVRPLPRPASFAVPVPLIVALLALEALTGGLAVVASRLFPRADATALVLISMNALILCSPLLFRAIRRQFDLLEPTVVFAVAYGVMFVVRPLALLVSGDRIYVRPSRAIDFADSFEFTLLLALIGSATFIIGYAAPWGASVAARIPRPPRELHPGTALAGTLATVVVAIMLFLVFVGTSGGIGVITSFLSGRSPEQTSLFRGSTAYLYTAPYMLIPATILLLTLARIRHDIVLGSLGVLVLFIVLLRAVPMGSRMMLLPLCGGLYVVYYLRRDRRPSMASALLLCVIILLGSTILLGVRTASSRGDRGTGDVVRETLSNPMVVFDPLVSGADTEMVETLAVAVQEIPRTFPYAYGGTVLGDLLIRPIPRIAWDSKPLSPRERLIGELWPEEYAAGVANPEFSSLLYYYWDFGALGVAVGMAVYGLLARTLFEFWRTNRKLWVAQLFYALTLPFIVIGLRDSPADTTMRLAFVLGPLVLIAVLSKRHEDALSSRSEPTLSEAV